LCMHFGVVRLTEESHQIRAVELPYRLLFLTGQSQRVEHDGF
jgi:hypothetical protein